MDGSSSYADTSTFAVPDSDKQRKKGTKGKKKSPSKGEEEEDSGRARPKMVARRNKSPRGGGAGAAPERVGEPFASSSRAPTPTPTASRSLFGETSAPEEREGWEISEIVPDKDVVCVPTKEEIAGHRPIPYHRRSSTWMNLGRRATR